MLRSFLLYTQSVVNMNMKSLTGTSDRKSPAGFTLVELLVVIAIIAILAGMLLPALAKAKQKANQASCMSNMKGLGVAFQMYLGDAKNELPYARLTMLGNKEGLCWDDLLQPYLGGTASLDQLSGVYYNVSNRTALKWAMCPADKVPATSASAVRRSYSMPQHGGPRSFAPAFDTLIWPPNPTSRSGVGLCLQQGAVQGTTTGPNSMGGATWKADSNPNSFNNTATATTDAWKISGQLAISADLITDNTGTALLVERVHPGNYAGQSFYGEIPNSDYQYDSGNEALGFPNTSHHGNESFNYLLADGHVEFLGRKFTLGQTNVNTSKQTGIWSITPKD